MTLTTLNKCLMQIAQEARAKPHILNEHKINVWINVLEPLPMVSLTTEFLLKLVHTQTIL